MGKQRNKNVGFDYDDEDYYAEDFSASTGNAYDDEYEQAVALSKQQAKMDKKAKKKKAGVQESDIDEVV
jgi:hypothetical protein